MRAHAVLFGHVLNRKPLAADAVAKRCGATDAYHLRLGKLFGEVTADLPHRHRVVADTVKQQDQLRRRGRRALDNEMLMFHR